jgi:hypothetical protein
MNPTKLLSVGMVGLFMASGVSAQNSVDVRKLDIAGVRLGMNYEEARQAVAKHFQIAVSELKPHVDFTGQTKYVLHPLTKAKLSPEYFVYKRNNVSLSVYFMFRVPEDKARPVTVERVSYLVPADRETVNKLRDSAIKKYGNPTISEGKWCMPSKKYKYACEGNMLWQLHNSLMLIDKEGGEAVSKFIAEKERKKTKINF